MLSFNILSKLLLEKNYNYQLPNDVNNPAGAKATLFYDFYAMEYINSHLNENVVGSMDLHKGELVSKDTNTLRLGVNQSDWESFVDLKEKLLKALKNELLHAAFFSFTSEMRHAERHVNELIHLRNGWRLIHDHEGSTKKSVYTKFFKQEENIGKFSNPKLAVDFLLTAFRQDKLYGPLNKEYPNEKNNTKDRQLIVSNVLRLIKRKNISKAEMVNCFSEFFNNFTWHDNFGGPAWGKITDGWLSLYYARKEKDIILQIDHMLDLQHNNGTLFNKLNEYNHPDFNYDWIDDVLDFKYNLKDPRAYFGKISFGSLFLRLLKATGAEGLDSFTKKQTKYQEDIELLRDMYNKFYSVGIGIYPSTTIDVTLNKKVVTLKIIHPFYASEKYLYLFKNNNIPKIEIESEDEEVDIGDGREKYRNLVDPYPDRRLRSALDTWMIERTGHIGKIYNYNDPFFPDNIRKKIKKQINQLNNRKSIIIRQLMPIMHKLNYNFNDKDYFKLNHGDIDYSYYISNIIHAREIIAKLNANTYVVYVEKNNKV